MHPFFHFAWVLKSSVSDSAYCKQCPRVLAEVEHIDDEADAAGINFVKIDDKYMAKEFGVFALPAILFFKSESREPVIYAGDLYDEQQILQWLLTQKDPSGDIIEAVEGSELMELIAKEEALAIYFCKLAVELVLLDSLTASRGGLQLIKFLMCKSCAENSVRNGNHQIEVKSFMSLIVGLWRNDLKRVSMLWVFNYSNLLFNMFFCNK